MTAEEYDALITKQNDTIRDLEAERDSLKTENAQRVEAQKKMEEELRKTKELNFTLSRQISAPPAKSLEQNIAEVFG